MKRSLLFPILVALVFTVSARAEEKAHIDEKEVIVTKIVFRPAMEGNAPATTELRCLGFYSDWSGSIWIPERGRWRVNLSWDDSGSGPTIHIDLAEPCQISFGKNAETPIGLGEAEILRTTLPFEWNKDIVFFKTNFGTMTIRLEKVSDSK